jgi:hypothetical protein
VNHRTARKLVGLLMAVAYCLTRLIVPVHAQIIPNITVTPSTTAAGAADVSYQLTFVVPSGLTNLGIIRVTFPSGYDVHNVVTSTTSILGLANNNASVANVTVEGQAVNVFVSRGLGVNEGASLTFSPSAHITNPAATGLQSISVVTLSPAGLPIDSGTGMVSIGTGGTTGGGTVGAGGVTDVLAIVDPARSGKAGRFDIDFRVAQGGALTTGQGDYVDITFPAGSIVPSSFPASTIKMFFTDVTSVQTLGTRLRLFIPSGVFVPDGSSCPILIMVGAGILLPTVPGTYALIVATSKQPNGSSSNSFLVVGTSVLGLALAVNPAQQGTTALYDLSFAVSATGGLTAGTDTITLTFPSGTTIPATIGATAVRVNAAASGGVSVNGLSLAITTPVSVSGGSTLSVAVNPEAGVRSPGAVGSYQLSVSTSQDTAPVAVSFSLTASQISTPVVQVSTGAAGQVASYAATFTTGPGGSLVAGIDRINVEFPAGTTLPASFGASSATVGVSPSTYVSPAGMIVSVTVPVSIGASTQVTVTFAESAGIRHPVTGGTYVLRVSTSRETTAVTSTSYAVSSVPVVTVSRMPTMPDGQHGYYRTKPTIALTAQSAIDTQPVISYHFDTNPDSVYGGQPLTALEGTHTLTYYATDRLGSRSEIGTLTIAVDSTPPVIALTSPRDGETLNSTSFVVQGTVDVGSTVQVNGQNITVDATGVFAAPVTIQGTFATVVVDATDVAGNAAHTSVSVSVDKTPPTLTVSQPVNFQKIQLLPIVVTGKTEVGAAVTVQGSAAAVLADGSFEYSIASAADGPLTVAVVASDAAGNTATRTLAVTVQSTKLIQMQVGATTALVNGEVVVLQTGPVIRSGSTLVPLRFVAETFGITPVWDGVFQIIDLPFGSHTIRLQIGLRFAGVDGKRVSLDAAPILLNGITLVPLRFIAETLGAEARWEAATRTIIIVYPRAS